MAIIDNEMLWRQFGAAIDMLGDALRDCPDELWEKRPWADQPDQWVAAGFSAFWYLGYHTLFWLDLYLTGAEEDAIYFLAPTKHKTRRQLEVTNMAVVREGNKAVLLVVDVQVGVMRNVWDAQRLIKNIGIAIEKARGQGVSVIWVQHSDDELVDGSPDWRLVPGLSPAEGEMRIHKHFNSSFEQTSLEETLARLGATHIVLAGAATNWCVRATAYGALDRSYDLTLIKDAHTTETIELENGIRIEAANIIRELNIAMTWLGYPGRTNSTASVEEVDFSVSGGVR